jgi:hypothetical protein
VLQDEIKNNIEKSLIKINHDFEFAFFGTKKTLNPVFLEKNRLRQSMMYKKKPMRPS